MRIALISDAFPPTKTSGAVQISDLAAEFERQGHSPCVITPSPGLRKGWEQSFEDGIEVLRVRCAQTKDVSYLLRGLREFMLPFSTFLQLAKSPVKLNSFDGVVWYSPTIFFGPLIFILKRLSHCKSYLILRDIFPQWAVDAGILNKGPSYWWLKIVEKYQYAVADVIGVQSPANLQYFEKHLSKRGGTIEVLHNWLAPFDLENQEAPSEIKCLGGKTIFVYAGNMGVAQDANSLISLAVALSGESGLHFLFVGRGACLAELKKRVNNESICNVTFIDEIGHQRIPGLLQACHIGMLTLDARHKTHNVPGKFLAYLRAGLPVLARVNEGNDLQKLINDEKVGLVSSGSEPFEDLVMHARLLFRDTELRRAYGTNGRNLADDLFSPARAVRQITNAISV